MTELLPCPFCGYEKHMVLSPNCTKTDPYDPGDRAFPVIRCGGCFTDVPGDNWDFNGASAVKRWNTRVGKTHAADDPEYTEGVCDDGAAILRDGVMMTVSDILETLNSRFPPPPVRETP